MSSIDDDDLVKEFIVESREHLSTIESDLLAIEDCGDDIDETLVNKVFRAAHSIKGGAAFFDLRVIQELAHKMENVLDMVRSRKMVPSPEVINILLQAFDRLRELVNNHTESNRSDISEMVVALTGLMSSFLPQEEKGLLQQTVEIPAGQESGHIEVSRFDLSQAAKRGEFVYLFEIDLIHDVQRHGKTPWDAMKELIGLGNIMECRINVTAVGTLEDEPSGILPMEVLYATILDPSMVGGACENLGPDRIKLIQDPESAKAPPAPGKKAGTGPRGRTKGDGSAGGTAKTEAPRSEPRPCNSPCGGGRDPSGQHAPPGDAHEPCGRASARPKPAPRCHPQGRHTGAAHVRAADQSGHVGAAGSDHADENAAHRGHPE